MELLTFGLRLPYSSNHSYPVLSFTLNWLAVLLDVWILPLIVFHCCKLYRNNAFHVNIYPGTIYILVVRRILGN